MPQAEQLLQELVNLKKEEMRRTRTSRILTFLFATLPVFIVIGLSIWGSILLFDKAGNAIDNLPTIMNNITEDQKDSFLEDIQSQLNP